MIECPHCKSVGKCYYFIGSDGPEITYRCKDCKKTHKKPNPNYPPPLRWAGVREVKPDIDEEG